MCECDEDKFEPLTSIEPVEQLLSKIKLTAAGCDGLPAWLLRSCSYELADIVALNALSLLAKFLVIGLMHW